jgi:hypothetical protein
MADTAQEYRFPLPNELDSLNSLGQPGLYGQIGQHSYRTEQRQVRHMVSSSSTGQVQEQPDMLVQPTGGKIQDPAAMLNIEFPPDVAAMMLTGNENQKFDINEKHREVIHDPHGRTEVFNRHQKRTGVNSTYENQEMMSYATQHFDSTNPPQDDSASEDQYVLRLVGAADVDTGDHIGYGANFKVGTETTSEDSLGSFSQQHKYGSLLRSFSDSDNTNTFTQHLAKIGQTEMEAVSIESLASFTQQQAKHWEDSPSEDNLSGYDQRQTNVGFTTTRETTTRQTNNMMHTLPPQKSMYDMSQDHPPEKLHYNTMRHLMFESSDQQHRQDIQSSHVRTHSTPAFQEPERKEQANRDIKEYFSYDLRPGLDTSPTSSVASSRIDITVNISEQAPKVQSETVERTMSSTTQMVQDVSDQKVMHRPPPPVMPKPPKTPDHMRGYDYTERLTIRGVIPGDTHSQTDVTERVLEQTMSENSPDGKITHFF